MKSPFRFAALGSLLLAGLLATAQAQVSSPKKIDYQGIVKDSSGALLNATPAVPMTYTAFFRIYSAQSGGSPLWSEQQAVTVSNGQFSVRLGEGAPVSGEPNPDISTVFNGSDRYLGMTIVIPPTTVGNSVEITPRLAFLTSPFSFVASRAGIADSVSQSTGSSSLNNTTLTGTLSGTVTNTATVTGGTFNNVTIGGTGTINGTFTNNATFNGGTFTNGTFSGNGANLTNLNASNVTTGQIADARLGSNVAMLNRSPQTFTGTTRITGSLGINSDRLDNSALTISSSGSNSFLYLHNPSAAPWELVTTTELGNGQPKWLWFCNNQQSFHVYGDGSYHQVSDGRLKRDVEPLGGVLDKVLQMRPVSYRFKVNSDKVPRSLGFIAQEIEPLFPEIVDDTEGTKSLAYAEFTPIAIGAIQESHQEMRSLDQQKQKQIEKLEHENGDLKKQVDALAKRLEALEARSNN